MLTNTDRQLLKAKDKRPGGDRITPSSPATVRKHNGKICPAERLNGKRYDDMRLNNLLVSASMNGTSGYQQNSL